jgi:hypothetical protein
VRKKHPLFQLMNIVGGYSDLTRLHLTICLCNYLLCCWMCQLMFHERPSCFLEQQIVTAGISSSLAIVPWLVGRELFKLAFRSNPFGMFSKVSCTFNVATTSSRFHIERRSMADEL